MLGIVSHKDTGARRCVKKHLAVSDPADSLSP